MKKIDSSPKAIRRRKAQVVYSMKRRSPKWKKRKSQLDKKSESSKKQKRKPFISLIAPENFSLIDNTEAVLEYFNEVRECCRHGKNIIIDISKIDVMDSGTIALMVANIKDKNFRRDSRIIGNAPKKENLQKLFTESGFYDHVNSNRSYSGYKSKNLLHNESNKTVVPKVAQRAIQISALHTSVNKKRLTGVYSTMVEAMQNTNNHAKPKAKGECLWWLYVYCHPNEEITSFSFVDLGVGIFGSAPVKEHVKRIFKGHNVFSNLSLVPDLLSGKIGSTSTGIDRKLRGKGIPQIAGSAKNNIFKTFYIITNDVKIDLKTGLAVKLSHNFKGTILHWELQNLN